MSIQLPNVLSEFTLVKFHVLDTPYTKSPSEAKAFAEGLLATAHASTLKFTEVIACRTLVVQNTFPDTRVQLQDRKAVVLEQNAPKLQHSQHMCYLKGPLTPKEFIEMMQFKKGISNEVWSEYMDRFSLIQPKSKL